MKKNTKKTPEELRAQQLKLAEEKQLEIERIIEAQANSDAFFRKLMEGDVGINFPIQRNHLDRWEMAELDRINGWREKCGGSILMDPPPSFYEALRLMRYVDDKSMRVKTIEREQEGRSSKDADDKEKG